MKPMLAKSIELDSIESYVRNDDWAVQQKLDGDRILVTVHDGQVTALNRAGETRRNAVPTAVLGAFRHFAVGDWCFDGELLGGELWLFDLPRAMESVTCEQPFRFRMDVLERLHAQWDPGPVVRVVPTAWTPAAKEKLVSQVHAAGGEGVMFKDVTAIYRPGKRSLRMLKAKFTHTADVVVAALGIDGKTNCGLVLFDNGRPVDVGTCSLQGKPSVAVGDVIEVRYLYASDDSKLYQPRMLRVRHDKPAVECGIDQLHFTNREVLAAIEEAV